jgi:serine/threonine protein phosphatase 1
MLKHYRINSLGRDIAVGDIHGCFSTLRTALAAVSFDEQRDRLFSVGDLVDRGPESRDVVEWLKQPWFHAVCGNHDFMAWRRALGDPYKDVDHRVHGGEWLDACTPERVREIGERLSQLPLAMEVETPDGLVGMVHADYPYDDWASMQAGTLDAQDVECCMWSEARYKTRYASTVRGLRALIHGHKVVRTPAKLGNVHFIDTGGWLDQGRFTLLDLHTLKPVRAR